jgi:uncharacterized membrane-anchored protein YitT (DUF2179 family)
MNRRFLSNLWEESQRFVLMTIGVFVVALGYSIFQVPYNIAAGGLSGVSIIVNHFTGWTIGTLYIVLNIPMFVLGFIYLGRWKFLVRTLFNVLVFSVVIDVLLAYLPYYVEHWPITDSELLSSIYAGIVGGIGGGLIYRAGATMGGTGVLGRVIQLKTGTPLSSVYLYTDGLIVLAAGLVFGWETALYAMLTLFLNGLASDYALEGPSSVRTATIITDQPEQMAQALINNLGRGVSHWQITGGFTGETHYMLFCAIYRPQVNQLKRVVAETDENAFVVIGDAHQALGYGFLPLRQKAGLLVE